MVWRWQQRFAEEGPDGLLRDKTRKPGKPPVPAGTVARVVALTCGEPPPGATHWTGRAMAKVAGISLRSVQRIWDAYQLQPHRVRSFKRSRDPRFAEKMADIVGLYLDPPAHTVVLSIASDPRQTIGLFVDPCPTPAVRNIGGINAIGWTSAFPRFWPVMPMLQER